MKHFEAFRNCVRILHDNYYHADLTHVRMHLDILGVILYEFHHEEQSSMSNVLFGYNAESDNTLLPDRVIFYSPSKSPVGVAIPFMIEPDPFESKWKPKTWLPTVKHPLIDPDIAMDTTAEVLR